MLRKKIEREGFRFVLTCDFLVDHVDGAGIAHPHCVLCLELECKEDKEKQRAWTFESKKEEAMNKDSEISLR